MIYAKIKDQEAHKHLNDASKASKNKNWYRRLKIIEFSADKYTVKQLSGMFDLCEATTRNYIHSYNQGGLDKLKPVKPPGRSPRIANWTREQWDEVLEQTPNQYEKLNTQSRQWTLERLRLYLREYHQVDVSISNIYRSLRRTGRRTGRSKLRVGSPDPDYTVKRKQIKELQDFSLRGQLTSDAAQLIVPDKQLARLDYPKIVVPELRGRLLFFDEANVSWCPDTGRIYRVAGEQAKIDSPGKNKTKYILGSLEYPTGEGLYEIYTHKTNEEVQAHWQHLMDMYPDDVLFVVRDNASSHVTPMLDDFLMDNEDRLCLVPLPTYSPHLNLIERLWKYMRDNITRNHFYLTFEELCEVLVDWLQTLPFERFTSLMGVP